MQLRIPRETLILIAEKWVNDNLARPLIVTGVRIDTGCGRGDAHEGALVLELERGHEDHESRGD